jgi:hypothetical protein
LSYSSASCRSPSMVRASLMLPARRRTMAARSRHPSAVLGAILPIPGEACGGSASKLSAGRRQSGSADTPLTLYGSEQSRLGDCGTYFLSVVFIVGLRRRARSRPKAVSSLPAAGANSSSARPCAASSENARALWRTHHR